MERTRVHLERDGDIAVIVIDNPPIFHAGLKGAAMHGAVRGGGSEFASGLMRGAMRQQLEAKA